MRIYFCNHCGGSLTGDTRFCGNCGRQTEEGRLQTKEKQDAERADYVSRSSAMALIFAGSIFGMFFLGIMPGLPLVLVPWITWAVDIGICLVAAWWVGGATLRHSFGRRSDRNGILLGCLIPVASLAVAYAYVALLPTPEPNGGSEQLQEMLGPYSSKMALILVLAVMPALVEEWMCRGVLWVTLRPISTRGSTIVVTAALFAFLHGLNGGFILELPHRFVMGLLLGWLRARTGSLWPCVLAHFLHNGAAVLLDG